MINEIKAGPVSGVFLVSACKTLRTQDKRPYTILELKDKHSSIKAFVWDKELSFIKPGNFIKASGTAKEHKGEIILKFDATSIMMVKSPIHLEDFIFSLDGVTVNKLWEELLGITNAVFDKFYKNVLDKLLEKHETFGEFSLRTCPLSKKYGAYSGALLEHIIYCCRHAKMIHQNYFDRNTPIDPDLLTTLIIMSNVGHLRAFKNIFAIEYTTVGKLRPIETISLEITNEIINSIDLKDDTKTLVLTQGILTPSYIEAMLVKNIKNLDILTAIYSKTLNFAKREQEIIPIETLGIEFWNK